ncbi:hypothetical protein GCM10020360_21570 [Nonlabens tegetincola]
MRTLARPQLGDVVDTVACRDINDALHYFRVGAVAHTVQKGPGGFLGKSVRGFGVVGSDDAVEGR